MEKLVERFLTYIKFNTMSCLDSDRIPSTENQVIFAKYLKEQLEHDGIQVNISESGVIYVHLPSNVPEQKLPAIGFVAHMDTPPDFNCDNIHPIFVEQYDGKEIEINKELGLKMGPEEYPFLETLQGHDLIVSDGTSILGADDKAAIAEIVTMFEILVANPTMKHGDVYAAFTVDEEIGKGIEYFDLSQFPCDFAYTLDIDGNDITCIDYETICNGRVDLTVIGKPVHPGNGAGAIRNASALAMEFHSMLPLPLDPYYAKDYDGFNHLQEFTGKVDTAYLRYRVANFEDEGLWDQMRTFQQIADVLNEKYGYPAFNVQMSQRSDNMKKYILQDFRCVEYAQQAMEAIGLTPTHKPIRGGTDGSLLSKMGLPTPNINNGSYNALSYFELVSIHHMKKCVELLLKIITI